MSELNHAFYEELERANAKMFRKAEENHRIVYLVWNKPMKDPNAKAILDAVGDIPPADASCHHGICSQAKCAHCQRIITAHMVIASLDLPDMLLGVYGTKDRANQEAADLGKALGAVLRIETRVVHV